jgi:predicted nuclease of predicted toxin-antitoxin system
MRLLLDENVPRALKAILSAYDVVTVQALGWAGVKNGDLVAKAEGDFDALITADRGIRYLQNLAGRKLAIIELPTNNRKVLLKMPASILRAVEAVAKQGVTYVVVPLERGAK